MADNTAALLDNGTKMNMVHAAVITSLVYGIFCSFADEVEYIWRRMKWSLPKVLYFIARYYCPIYLLIDTIFPYRSAIGTISASVIVCRVAAWFHGGAGIFIIGTSVDLIFMLRVKALYGSNWKVGVFLMIALIAQFTSALIISVLLAAGEAANAIPVTGVGCLLSYNGVESLQLILKLLDIYYGISLTLHGVLFILTVVRVGSDFIRDNGGIKNIFRDDISSFSPVLKSVAFDGTLSFLILVVIILIEMIDTGPNQNIFGAILPPFHIAFQSCAGSWLILRLKKLSDSTMGNNPQTVTRSIFFARSGRGSDQSVEDDEDVIWQESV